MLSKHIDFKNGIILKDDFIDINESLISQKDLLYEDMFLVDYPNLGICLDIGWYNGSIKKGTFIVSLIKDEKWDQPLIKVNIKTLDELIININAVLAFIDVLQRHRV